MADRDLELLRSLVESIAALKSDGHLTLLRFTNGWKVGLGTPDLQGGLGYGQVLQQPVHPTLVEALRALVIEQPNFEEP
jgi:hypothetical protein